MSDMRLGSIWTISDYCRGLKGARLPASFLRAPSSLREASVFRATRDPRDGQKMFLDLIDPSYHLGSATTWESARYVRIAN
jgi:hypothetical protein